MADPPARSVATVTSVLHLSAFLMQSLLFLVPTDVHRPGPPTAHLLPSRQVHRVRVCQVALKEEASRLWLSKAEAPAQIAPWIVSCSSSLDSQYVSSLSSLTRPSSGTESLVPARILLPLVRLLRITATLRCTNNPQSLVLSESCLFVGLTADNLCHYRAPLLHSQPRPLSVMKV
jgi:hypothetical protein